MTMNLKLMIAANLKLVMTMNPKPLMTTNLEVCKDDFFLGLSCPFIDAELCSNPICMRREGASVNLVTPSGSNSKHKCKVTFTTRFRCVYEEMGAQKTLKVGMLSEEKSLILFRQKLVILLIIHLYLT
ncbi:hypothetical protein H5410_052414 [Solanum commersonii]|uniref:Uncharacterized protein n=1 Tax=Solanum commersonii TaxID=4109 RepID=A0A9J5X121_SOLCO|nr:hypothetical protein H5410_052414 [Solanum commersonii]